MTLYKEKMDDINSLLTKDNKVRLVNSIHGTTVYYDGLPICTLEELHKLIDDLQDLRIVTEVETGLVL